MLLGRLDYIAYSRLAEYTARVLVLLLKWINRLLDGRSAYIAGNRYPFLAAMHRVQYIRPIKLLAVCSSKSELVPPKPAISCRMFRVEAP